MSQDSRTRLRRQSGVRKTSRQWQNSALQWMRRWPRLWATADWRAGLVACGSAMFASTVCADTPPPADATATPSAAANDPAALAARVAELERQMAQMANSQTSRHLDLGIPIHGFANVDFAESGMGQDTAPRRGFNAGAIEFYLNPQIGDRVRTLVEMQFEYNDGGEVGVDLERTQLGYQYADNSVFWVGRFHIPFGYWNTAFHHGAFIQTSLTRPRFIRFEDQGGVIPAHAVGPWINGRWATSVGKLAYDFYASNGDKLDIAADTGHAALDFNAFTDDNSSKMVGGKLAWMFRGALDGLEAGIHGYRDRVNSYSGDEIANSNRITMGGGLCCLRCRRNAGYC